MDIDQMTEEFEGHHWCEGLHPSHDLALGARHGGVDIETMEHRKQSVDTVHVHDHLLQSAER